ELLGRLVHALVDRAVRRPHQRHLAAAGLLDRGRGLLDVLVGAVHGLAVQRVVVPGVVGQLGALLVDVLDDLGVLRGQRAELEERRLHVVLLQDLDQLRRRLRAGPVVVGERDALQLLAVHRGLLGLLALRRPAARRGLAAGRRTAGRGALGRRLRTARAGPGGRRLWRGRRRARGHGAAGPGEEGEGAQESRRRSPGGPPGPHRPDNTPPTAP